MGRGDYLSRKGQESRIRGMKEKESKKRKYTYFAVFAVSFVVFVLLMGHHVERTNNAFKIND